MPRVVKEFLCRSRLVGDVNIPLLTTQQARLTVDEIFREIGISVTLCRSAPVSATGCVSVALQLLAHSPERLQPGSPRLCPALSGQRH